MNKKLRLLLTTRCPNKCPMCCNNSWDFSRLPVVERWDYEQIVQYLKVRTLGELKNFGDEAIYT